MTEKPSYEQHFETASKQNGERRPSKKKSGGFLEFLVILVISFVLVFGFVRPFVVEAFFIPSESMVHTLEVGDRVLVNKFIYRFTEPERGDIAVFESVEGGNEDLIKRIVGLPGDTIEVRNGKLFVNGERQREPYVNRSGLGIQAPYGPKKVPKNHYFFMGDNRANSRDSRFFGAVPKKNIEGEAFLRFWPLNRIGLL